jgi:hypothetical protein
VWCATQHTLQWNADSVCVLTVAQGAVLTLLADTHPHTHTGTTGWQLQRAA